MSTTLLADLENKIDQLINACQQLSDENRTLQQQLATNKERESAWQQERSRLVEKNEMAKRRVEAMISRLKSLEENH